MEKKCCKHNFLIGLILIILSPFVFYSMGTAGILFLLTGIFALISVKKKKRLPVIILSAITLGFSIIGLISSLISVNISIALIDPKFNTYFDYYSYFERYFVNMLPSLNDQRLNYSILMICKDNLVYFTIPYVYISLFVLLRNTIKCKTGRVIYSSIIIFLIIITIIPAIKTYVSLFNCYDSIYGYLDHIKNPIIKIIDGLINGSSMQVEMTVAILYIKSLFNSYTNNAIISLVILGLTIYLSLNEFKFKCCKKNKCEVVEEKVEA